MRLIDADALSKKVSSTTLFIKDAEVFQRMINDAPTIVQIVDHDREWIIGCIKHDGFIKTDRFDKANQIILDALSATNPENVQNCGDLISRADAISALNGIGTTWEQDCEIQRVVESVPSVSAEPKRGEWKRVGHDIWECSSCHQNVMTRDIDCYNFCHRCGAKMKGGA